MPEFISKLQHKTYEKGEFSDEKVRSLDETIELIKTFPWDAERTLTDVQLTGPSVTIRDEDINFLKVGLYFNGKYCLYYLDSEKHLYEYHAPDIEDACKIVTDFFNGRLDLEKFEKHILNVGSQAHFVTNYFEYREKPWRILMITALLLIYAVITIFLDVTLSKVNGAHAIKIVGFILSVIYYYVVIKIFFVAVMNRNNYLQLSRGNDEFSFGYFKNLVKTYNKNNIHSIVIYRSGGSRNPNLICVYEIYFKDGTKIKFSNMLISDFAFADKFPNNTITYGKKSPLKMLS